MKEYCIYKRKSKSINYLAFLCDNKECERYHQFINNEICDKCKLYEECTHEITNMGRCIGCGKILNEEF